jgi:biotin carboxyl carrier protein
MRYFVTLGAREIPIDVTALPGGGWNVLVDGRPITVDAAPAGGALCVIVDGRVVDLVLEGSAPDVRFTALGPSGGATLENDRTRSGASQKGGRGGTADKAFIVAPMPGRVVRLLVAAGDQVEVGTPMVVVEAMKMENELRANHPGTVAEILVRPGDTVEGGAKLIRLA